MPTSQEDSIPWRHKPYQSVRNSAELLNCSEAQIYAYRRRGALEFVTIVGKTQVRTDGIIKLLDEPEPWVDQHRADVAHAALARKRKDAKARAADVRIEAAE